MPSVLGIQVQEEGGPGQSIARAPTALAAFVGRTLRGPINRPVLLQSFSEFQHIFGGLWQPSPLGYAVEQFFDNGGADAFIVRIVNGAKPATLSIPAGRECLTLQAKRPGTREFLRVCIDYDNIANADQHQFNLTVQRLRTHGTEYVEDQEIFRAVSLVTGSERTLQAALVDSELVCISGPLPATRPNRTLDPASGIATGYVSSNPNGDDGGPLSDYDLIGSAIDGSGIFALNQVEHFSVLCIPPLARDQDVGASVLLVAARYCKERRAMLIVDPPTQWTTAEEALRELRGWGFYNENSLMYFPRILAHDKLRGRFESFAPCGAVAGMLARSDRVRPLWAAEHSAEAILRPGFRLNCVVTEERRSQLAAMGVNTLQSVRSSARCGDSPRTLAAGSAANADWKYLTSRRLALFIVNSVERGTRWLVFAPRGAELSHQVHVQICQFFEMLNDEGAFSGRVTGHAYFVICDGRVNPPQPMVSNEFNILLGFAAARTGEFHSYLITHSSRGSCAKAVSLNRIKTLRDPDRILGSEQISRRLFLT